VSTDQGGPRGPFQPDRSRARPREGQSLAPPDGPPRDRLARSPGPDTAGRIARPSAGSGSYLEPDAGPGCRAFPPPGGLGPIGAQGNPDRPLNLGFTSRTKCLRVNRGGVRSTPLRDSRYPTTILPPLTHSYQWDSARRGTGFVRLLGVAETRPKPVRNGREGPEKVRLPRLALGSHRPLLFRAPVTAAGLGRPHSSGNPALRRPARKIASERARMVGAS